MQTRLVNINKDNQYRLMLTREKSAQKGYVLIKLSGEQSNVNAKIKSAFLYPNQNELLKCTDGKIFLGSFNEKEKISVVFSLDYEDNCSMEVALYGYSL